MRENRTELSQVSRLHGAVEPCHFWQNWLTETVCTEVFSRWKITPFSASSRVFLTSTTSQSLENFQIKTSINGPAWCNKLWMNYPSKAWILFWCLIQLNDLFLNERESLCFWVVSMATWFITSNNLRQEMWVSNFSFKAQNGSNLVATLYIPK